MSSSGGDAGADGSVRASSAPHWELAPVVQSSDVTRQPPLYWGGLAVVGASCVRSARLGAGTENALAAGRFLIVGSERDNRRHDPSSMAPRLLDLPGGELAMMIRSTGTPRSLGRYAHPPSGA